MENQNSSQNSKVTDSNIEMAKGCACMGLDLAGTSVALGEDKSDSNDVARQCLSSAQSKTLTQINQEDGTSYSTLFEAVKSGNGDEYDSALNSASNVAKHDYDNYRP